MLSDNFNGAALGDILTYAERNVVSGKVPMFGLILTEMIKTRLFFVRITKQDLRFQGTFMFVDFRRWKA